MEPTQLIVLVVVAVFLVIGVVSFLADFVRVAAPRALTLDPPMRGGLGSAR